MVERILARSGPFKTQPRLGPVVSEFDDEAIGELFVDPFRVVYRVGEAQIDIVAVAHAARRLPWGLWTIGSIWRCSGPGPLQSVWVCQASSRRDGPVRLGRRHLLCFWLH